MSVNLTTAKNNLIKRIAQDQGFADNYTIEVSSGSTKGDGYLGIITTIQIQSKNQPHKKLNLILKSALTGEKIRELAPIRNAYEREIFLYEQVFPELKQFQQKYGIKNIFQEHPKCYGSSLTETEECLVLENLKTQNYNLWNRMKPMNQEHIELVFQTYGKLHGASLALRHLEPQKFEELTKNMFNIFVENSEDGARKMAGSVMENYFENGFKAVAGDERATKSIQRFFDQSGSFFEEDLKKKVKFFCILHGDCWCNNIMFQYNDSKDPTRPTGIRLLDWQVSQVGSCVIDLSYFFYTSASKEVLTDLPKFLEMYYVSLSTVMKEADCNSEDIPSFEELQVEWKLFSKYGLFMSFFIIKIMLAEVDDAPDFNELAKDGKNLIQSINQSGDGVHAEEVNKRIANIIYFMMEHEYL